MSRAVAFFDLDQGVLRTPATKLVSEHLVSPGRDRTLFLQRTVNRIGGPLPGGIVGRALSHALAGTDEKAVVVAGAGAAAEAKLAPHARVIMDEHRSEGRRLVATTQVPMRCARPVAEALGFDDVIATRYGATAGHLDGSVEGPLVWGRGKLTAIKDWAKANDASLRRGWFYSGAFADVAVLSAVGNPVVCDPDARLAGLAWLKGWPTRSLYAPAGVARPGGLEVQDVVRPFSFPQLMPNARFRFEGLDNIPKDGPAIVCGNHRSYFDAFALGFAITKTGRPARFLGKKEVFDVPVVGTAARWIGGIRVERGTGSDEPLRAAEAALHAGELIGLMPEGTIPRGPAFFEPELKGRWGAAKLAHATKAPVIPLGIWGTEQVWPRSSRIPNLNPLDRPLVTVTAGPPVELGYADLDQDTNAIMRAIVDLLPPQARQQHEPTPEELARTYPPGYKGDPAKELVRRPGTDT